MNRHIAQLERPLPPWDVAQTISGFVVVIALVFSWAWTLSFVNRITIYLNRDAYKPADFIVTGAVYDRSGELGPDYWLTGLVAGRKERLVPRLNGAPEPRSADDLLLRFPKDKKIEVLYNSDATEMLSQSESLRVLEARPNLWQDEAKSTVWLGIRVLLPVPVTIAIYLTVRCANQRRRQMKCSG